MGELAGASLAFSTSILGFVLLALAMSRHWSEVTGQAALSEVRIKVLRAAGFSALAVGLALAVFAQGPGFGSVLWVMALTTSAAAVALTLTWRPRWLRPLAKLMGRGSGC
ncbi:MAG TPA: DUF3325 domain-containing protein [Pseudoxanthomonas sp.]|nr:DUF3325 domain-containing protein [Pseudoxanthomonas sp.]